MNIILSLSYKLFDEYSIILRLSITDGELKVGWYNLPTRDADEDEI